ncbi:MAG: hypothetical protein ACPGXX_20220, partial [Planctomycetaceae bacterium]
HARGLFQFGRMTRLWVSWPRNMTLALLITPCHGGVHSWRQIPLIASSRSGFPMSTACLQVNTMATASQPISFRVPAVTAGWKTIEYKPDPKR